VVIPSVLAEQAGGRQEFEVDADTVGAALRALPIADLLFNERGEWHEYLCVYVDGTDARLHGGPAFPLTGAHEVRAFALYNGS
jgi:hypothetical protein